MIHFDKETFDKTLAEGKLTLVDFWASWCGPCQMLGPVIEELAETYEGRVLTAKVNVDENQELAVRFGVELIPTVVFLKNGREFHRFTGVVSMEALAEVLDRS